jgi:threonine/homoserine/homoserine lactone efflux protein
VLILVPGPDMIFILGRGIAQGRKAGVVATFGTNAGAYVHLVAAVSGLSAILVTSSIAFTAVKLAGAVYLTALGVQTLLDRGAGTKLSVGIRLDTISLRAIFWQGFLSDVLNPKVAIFFVALLPQFVNLRSGHPIAQLLLLGLTVNVLGLVGNLTFVVISARVSSGLRRSPQVSRWLQRAMGVTFIGLGARLALERF